MHGALIFGSLRCGNDIRPSTLRILNGFETSSDWILLSIFLCQRYAVFVGAGVVVATNTKFSSLVGENRAPTTTMEHVRAFANFPGLTEMQMFLASSDTPFAASELYSSEKDAKIVDPELRKSRFRKFRHETIFDSVDQLVQWLNESDDNYSYQLRRDDITETRYEAGGHFLKHKDFLSVASNIVEEFTLLMCVTPSDLLPKAAVGGETLLFPYGSDKGTPFNTTTPGAGVLFRKDLDHSGSLLQTGEKHILTANLWATRKQASEQVLFVTFPRPVATEDTATAELKRVANQDTSYALPVDCLRGTMLDAHVRFVNQTQGTDELSIIEYECTDFDFDEFGTVYKILMRTYVEEDCIRQHEAAIDFFGPFSNENLLVNLALESKPTDAEASCERFVKPANLNGPFRKKVKTKGKPKSEETNDLTVIVCENESRSKVVYEVAQKLGFDSYVPFKMIFVQGVVTTGYYESFDTVGVTPVVLVVGDYNHVFGIQPFENIQAATLRELHEKHTFDVDGSGVFDAVEYDSDFDQEWQDRYEKQMEFTRGAHGFGLKVAMGEGDVREHLTTYISNCSDQDGDFFDGSNFFSPCTDEGDKKASSQEADGINGAPTLFHRDEDGKVVFNKAEAVAASDFIAEMNIDGRVKASKWNSGLL